MQKRNALKVAIGLESGIILAAMPITFSVGLIAFTVLAAWAVLKHFEHRKFVAMAY